MLIGQFKFPARQPYARRELKKRKKYVIILPEVVKFTSGDAFTDSFIVSNRGQKHRVSDHTSVKTHFFTGKMIITALKRYFRIVGSQLDEGVFPTFGARLQRL